MALSSLILYYWVRMEFKADNHFNLELWSLLLHCLLRASVADGERSEAAEFLCFLGIFQIFLFAAGAS